MLKSMKSFALAGAASLALCAASAAYASPDDPSQQSTPAERQQTEQLNAQGSNGVAATPAELNGQSPSHGYGNMQPASDAQPVDDSAPMQNTPSQQNYNAQQQQYQEQQQQYQDQQAQYQQRSAQYNYAMARYDRSEWNYTDYPHPYAYRYRDDQLRRIYLIEDPTHQLAQAPVEDPSGRWIGRVRNVDINSGGQPLRVEVALNRHVSVWVSPDHFRFDAADHVVFTDLTRDDLWHSPSARYESLGS